MHGPFYEGSPRARWRLALLMLIALLTLVLPGGTAFAHAVAEGDKGYIQEITGVHFVPFMYLGAKHMITGYDHLEDSALIVS